MEMWWLQVGWTVSFLFYSASTFSSLSFASSLRRDETHLLPWRSTVSHHLDLVGSPLAASVGVGSRHHGRAPCSGVHVALSPHLVKLAARLQEGFFLCGLPRRLCLPLPGRGRAGNVFCPREASLGFLGCVSHHSCVGSRGAGDFPAVAWGELHVHTMVPSGISPRGSTFPISTGAPLPTWIGCPS